MLPGILDCKICKCVVDLFDKDKQCETVPRVTVTLSPCRYGDTEQPGPLRCLSRRHLPQLQPARPYHIPQL